MGIPTSIINFIQEMGRCGRIANSDNELTENACHLMFNLKEFVHLNERLFYEDSSDESDELEMNSNIMSKDDESLMIQQ